MPKRILVFFIMLAAVLGTKATGYAQNPLDSYKYIIVPKKFDFLKKENQYRVNSHTKYLFDSNGYTTVLKGEEYPEDLLTNPCLGVEANVIDESNTFTTKVKISLTNCQDQVIYTTEQGRSKEKEYVKSYSLALNNAFQPIAEMGYEFNPNLTLGTSVASSPSLEPEVQDETPVQAEVVAVEPVAEPEPIEAEVAEAAVEAVPAATAAAVPAAVPAGSESPKKESGSGGATTYGNDNISFFLIEQGTTLAAYVVRSTSGNYAQGEKIGTFEKSSLPNVYRVQWKDMDKDIEQTTGYFDEQGNLKIDVKRNGKVEVLTFMKE
jgi:hypothetical protein